MELNFLLENQQGLSSAEGVSHPQGDESIFESLLREVLTFSACQYVLENRTGPADLIEKHVNRLSLSPIWT